MLKWHNFFETRKRRCRERDMACLSIFINNIKFVICLTVLEFIATNFQCFHSSFLMKHSWLLAYVGCPMYFIHCDGLMPQSSSIVPSINQCVRHSSITNVRIIHNYCRMLENCWPKFLYLIRLKLWVEESWFQRNRSDWSSWWLIETLFAKLSFHKLPMNDDDDDEPCN